MTGGMSRGSPGYHTELENALLSSETQLDAVVKTLDAHMDSTLNYDQVLALKPRTHCYTTTGHNLYHEKDRQEFAMGVAKQRFAIKKVQIEAKTLLEQEQKGKKFSRDFCSRTMAKWEGTLKKAPTCATTAVATRISNAIPYGKLNRKEKELYKGLSIYTD